MLVTRILQNRIKKGALLKNKCTLKPPNGKLLEILDTKDQEIKRLNHSHGYITGFLLGIGTGYFLWKK